LRKNYSPNYVLLLEILDENTEPIWEMFTAVFQMYLHITVALNTSSLYNFSEFK